MGLEQRLIQLIDEIQRGITTHAPEALAITLRLIRIEALFDLIGSAVIFGVTFLAVRTLVVFWRQDPSTTDDLILDQPGKLLLSIIVGLAGGAGLVWGLTVWFSARTWLALIDPRLALAHDLIHKVMK